MHYKPIRLTDEYHARLAAIAAKRKQSMIVVLSEMIEREEAEQAAPRYNWANPKTDTKEAQSCQQ